jgi:hypothetical protein
MKRRGPSQVMLQGSEKASAERSWTVKIMCFGGKISSEMDQRGFWIA